MTGPNISTNRIERPPNMNRTSGCLAKRRPRCSGARRRPPKVQQGSYGYPRANLFKAAFSGGFTIRAPHLSQLIRKLT